MCDLCSEELEYTITKFNSGNKSLCTCVVWVTYIWSRYDYEWQPATRFICFIYHSSIPWSIPVVLLSERQAWHRVVEE